MLQITKIFRFEMAHAIYGYKGGCGQIHGHSYELQVTIAESTGNSKTDKRDYLGGTGFIMDFKDLKRVVQEHVISLLDHRLVLSRSWLAGTPTAHPQNLLVAEAEPTAENLLLFISRQLIPALPENIRLQRLLLYETKDSFAEWINEG